MLSIGNMLSSSNISKSTAIPPKSRAERDLQLHLTVWLVTRLLGLLFALSKSVPFVE
jgi:LEA14-like dessication related protein